MRRAGILCEDKTAPAGARRGVAVEYPIVAILTSRKLPFALL